MRRHIPGIVVFFLAFGILSISVLKTASPNYAFSSPSPVPLVKGSQEEINVNYQLPHPGGILPDNPLWSFKAARDRIWYIISFSSTKKSELNLLFADKRLVMSKMLFENGKPDLAFSTLTKAEKYLDSAVSVEKEAREDGVDTTNFLTKLATASLKHREVVKEVIKIAPEDAKPEIIVIENRLKEIYKITKEVLNSKGKPAPISPFDGE